MGEMWEILLLIALGFWLTVSTLEDISTLEDKVQTLDDEVSNLRTELRETQNEVDSLKQ